MLIDHRLVSPITGIKIKNAGPEGAGLTAGKADVPVPAKAEAQVDQGHAHADLFDGDGLEGMGRAKLGAFHAKRAGVVPHVLYVGGSEISPASRKSEGIKFQRVAEVQANVAADAGCPELPFGESSRRPDEFLPLRQAHGTSHGEQSSGKKAGFKKVSSSVFHNVFPFTTESAEIADFRLALSV